MTEYQEFKCKICEKVLSNLKFYTHHLKLHQNISNFNFPCPFSTCERKYTKATSLRAHIARDHIKAVKKLTLEHSRLTDLNCNVPFCKQTYNESSDLISHLQVHIRKNDSVLYPYGCGKKFSKRSTFSAHLSRKHRNIAQIPENSYNIQSISAENCAIQEETLFDTTADKFEVQSTNIYLSLAQFCLRLITKFHVPYSAIDVMMSEISNIHVLTKENLLCCMKAELGKFETISENVKNEILKKFSDNNLFTEVFSNNSLLKSDYLRKKYFKQNFNFIDPIAIKLGRNKQNKIATYHYVPILESLTPFIQHPSIKRQLLNPILSNEQNLLCDYTDGSIFKAMPFFQDSKVLKVFLYQDSFETVNPLGSAKKKHKILTVYYTLGNVFPYFRSKVDPMQLVLLCKQTDFEYFGHEKVFRPLVRDLKKLENGIEGQEFLQGSIFAILGDNLGSHCIGGFMENFSSSHYHCRYCCVHKNDMFTDNMSYTIGEIRTKEKRTEILEFIDENEVADYKGVKFNSLFNELQHYNVCQPGLPPCIGHDLFEGVVAYDLHLYIVRFAHETSLTLSEINNKISKFSYLIVGNKDKPAAVSTKHKKLGGHAVQNWNCLRFFPVIFFDYMIPETECKNLIVLLHKITELICAQKTSVNQVYYMQELIIEYLEKRSEEFPNVPLRAKHHFILHSPAMTLKFGPLIRMWTMRFESKHSYFKKSAQRSPNFLNITKSLSEKHQLLQAYIETGSMYEEISLDSSVPFRIQLFERGIKTAVSKILGEQAQLALFTVKLCFHGVEYRKDMFVVLQRIEKQLIFGKIKFILLLNNNMYFVLSVVESEFINRSNVYLLIKNQKEKVECVPYENVLYFYPLQECQTMDGN